MLYVVLSTLKIDFSGEALGKLKMLASGPAASTLRIGKKNIEGEKGTMREIHLPIHHTIPEPFNHGRLLQD